MCFSPWDGRVGHDLKVNMKERESESRSVVSNSSLSHGLYSPWNFPGQNTGVGSLPFLQGVFPMHSLPAEQQGKATRDTA